MKKKGIFISIPLIKEPKLLNYEAGRIENIGNNCGEREVNRRE